MKKLEAPASTDKTNRRTDRQTLGNILYAIILKHNACKAPTVKNTPYVSKRCKTWLVFFNPFTHHHTTPHPPHDHTTPKRLWHLKWTQKLFFLRTTMKTYEQRMPVSEKINVNEHLQTVLTLFPEPCLCM